MHAVCIALLLALAPVVARAGVTTPTPVMINCADAVGIPGGTAAVSVALVAQGDAMVAGTENDLQFDSALFSIRRNNCFINPAIGPGTDANKQLQQNVLGDPGQAVRALVVALDSVNVIPPGLLYTCPFRVAADAAEGSYDVVNTNLVASTAKGTPVPVNGESCHIVVAAATVTPTPTPRCRDNTDCPSGQVCVDGECVTATPTPTPPGFCNDNNDCPPGEVCVDHRCVTPTATATPIGFCNNNDDCPAGQVCVDHRCVTPTPTSTPIGFCTNNHDCPPGQVCVNNQCVTPTPTPLCSGVVCPPGSICVDGICIITANTPTATPTTTHSSGGGGGGCNCEIDPGAGAPQTSGVLAVLLPALVLLLRWRSRRAGR